MRIYIAGPMTGLPELNFPAFHAAAKEWRAAGWDVFNPAESHDGRTDLPYREYVDTDLAVLRSCDAVALLPGWDGPDARGSVWERAVAMLLGLSIYDALAPEPPRARETICEEADRLVAVDRQGIYGHPIDDFTKTAKIWTGLAQDILRPGVEFSPEHVALFMVGVKLSRLKQTPDHRDSMVDAIGYVKTYQLVRERRGEAGST